MGNPTDAHWPRDWEINSEQNLPACYRNYDDSHFCKNCGFKEECDYKTTKVRDDENKD